MFRIFITYLLPLVAPFLMYLAWNAYIGYKAKKVGEEPPSLEKGPIFWCIITGLVLMIASLVTFALLGGDAAGGAPYSPPRLEDGKIVPPSFGQ